MTRPDWESARWVDDAAADEPVEVVDDEGLDDEAPDPPDVLTQMEGEDEPSSCEWCGDFDCDGACCDEETLELREHRPWTLPERYEER